LDLEIEGGDSLGVEFGIVEFLEFGITVCPLFIQRGFSFQTLSYGCLL
jgi:hypothetical protein